MKHENGADAKRHPAYIADVRETNTTTPVSAKEPISLHLPLLLTKRGVISQVTCD